MSKNYNYRVSKKNFKKLNSMNDHMLFGVGRMFTNEPFSDTYHQEIFPIKIKHKKICKTYIKDVVIPNYLNFLYDQVHDNFPDLQIENFTCLTTKIKSLELESHIKDKLKYSLIKLQPDLNLDKIFQHGLHYIAWKVTDNIMFMNNDWNLDFPTWKCEICFQKISYSLLIMHLTHGLVIISFLSQTS
jgi:hypothetical protein